ncbi:hypothetical protein J4206_01640 [Candidatus Woesearchaeota archaeon]|nr:hypothetical protein [Candidatus Woesearchaeota archaeon]
MNQMDAFLVHLSAQFALIYNGIIHHIFLANIAGLFLPIHHMLFYTAGWPGGASPVI